MHKHHNFFLNFFFLLLTFYTLYCLSSLSFQPLHASSHRCSLLHLQKDTPVALIIANNYEETLVHPLNDANAMEQVLRNIGFRIIFKIERNKKTINKVIHDFSNCLQISKGVGLFYFTGYGVQVNDENYLLPINAHIEEITDVEYEAFPVSQIISKLKISRNELNIIILDASRDNPYFRNGLASMSPPPGFLIAYPAGIGKTVVKEQYAINSLYVRQLTEILRKAKQKKERIENVFMQVATAVEKESQKQQVPMYFGSTKKPFCFGGCSFTVTPSRHHTTVKLTVRSNVNGARVFIDGKLFGNIHGRKLNVTVREGLHTIKVEKEGYKAFERSISVIKTRRAPRVIAFLRKK